MIQTIVLNQAILSSQAFYGQVECEAEGLLRDNSCSLFKGVRI